MGHSEQRKSAMPAKILERVLDYVPRRTTDALSFCPSLSLHTPVKPELVNKQRKELSSLDFVLGSI